MADRNELVLRPSAPLARVQPVRTRLDDSRERLRLALEQVKGAARDLTPAARISERPFTWIMGGLLLGVAFGLLTAARRSSFPLR